MATKTEPTERPSARAVAGESDEGLRDILKNLEPLSENKMKRRGSRGFVRFLVAICIGVAATLVWQSYGEAIKQIIATRAPELGWSPAAKQMIASWVLQFGWTKPPPSPQTALMAQTAPAAITPSTPIVPAVNPEQVHQIAVDLSALRQTVAQIADGQEQMRREINTLQGAVAEILIKIPETPPPPLTTASARKPKPAAATSSRAPAPLPPHP
jgi:hypothetical protein